MIHSLKLTLAPLFAVVFFSTSGASASTIFVDTFSPQQSGWSITSPAGASSGYMGPLHNFYNVASVTLTLPGVSAAPLGLLEFDLLVFDTLDHDNCCTDTFTMSVNSSTMFTGAFSGADFDPVVQPPVFNDNSHFFTNPSATTTTRLGPMTFALGILNGFDLTSSWAWHFSVPIALLDGTNTFTWSYAVNQPITAVDREAWGIDNVRVSSSVPEPATLLLIGFGIVGLMGMRAARQGRDKNIS